MADPNQSTRSTAAMDITSFTSIKGVFFGMGFMLYCMCVGVFLGDIQKRRRPWRQTAIAFAYCSMMVSFGLTDLATNTAAITWAFTDNNGSTQAALAALTLANGAPPVLVVWKSIAPFLLVALPAPMQVRLLCLDNPMTLTSLDLAGTGYLDCVLLCCSCCQYTLLDNADWPR
jgi:hypothetical protein